MSRGHFECCGEENGVPAYRVRWSEEPEEDLSEDEQRYALFVRYLIRHSRLNEGWSFSAHNAW